MFRNITVGSLKTRPSHNESTEATNSLHPLTTQFRPPVIRLLQQGKAFKVTPIPGGNLLQTALDQRKLLEYNCKKGSCGTCKVQLIDGEHLLECIGAKELKLLAGDAERGHRLACQAKIR